MSIRPFGIRLAAMSNWTVTVLSLLTGGLVLAAPAAATDVSAFVTEFPAGTFQVSRISTVDAKPSGIVAGPDGHLWLTETGANHVGSVTADGVFAWPGQTGVSPANFPGDIVVGPDGNLWVGENKALVGRIAPSGGGLTEFPTTSAGAVPGVAAGSDGNIWFTGHSSGGVALIGRMSTSGAGVVTFPLANVASRLRGIVAGPDRALWFTDPGAGAIGRITTAGVITEFTAGIAAGAAPEDIAAGSDGNLWFTEPGTNRIGRITTGGVVTEFAAGISAGAGPDKIVAGSGALWFSEPSADRVARITTSGAVTEFSAGITAGAGIHDIAVTPDGSVWFTEGDAHAVARLAFAPTNSVPPGVTGDPHPGATLTATNGTWSGAPITYSRQWQQYSGGVWTDIAGATQPTYTVADGDIGHPLRILVAAHHLGASLTIASAATPSVVDFHVVTVPGPLVIVPGPTVMVPGPTVTIPGSANVPAAPTAARSGPASIGKGARIAVTCLSACRATAKLVISGPTARKFKLSHTTPLATAVDSVLRAGSVSLLLRASSKVRAKLKAKHVSKLAATARISVLDATGTTTKLTLALTLGR
jgi:streptogramin lyase